jgi:hypothetical protein
VITIGEDRRGIRTVAGRGYVLVRIYQLAESRTSRRAARRLVKRDRRILVDVGKSATGDKSGKELYAIERSAQQLALRNVAESARSTREISVRVSGHENRACDFRVSADDGFQSDCPAGLPLRRTRASRSQAPGLAVW